jgi:hypothetical protein
VNAVTELAESRAYVSPAQNGWVTIYDEASDGQNDEVIRTFASELSRKLNIPVIACLVHDSDVAVYWLFDRGELVDEFNSNPDYFGAADAETHDQVRGRVEALLPICVAGTSPEQLDAILHPEEGPPLIAEAMLTDLASSLGIEENRMSLSFEYFENEAEEILPDVAEFQPVGEGARRKSPGSRNPVSNPRPATTSKPNQFALAVGMMAHDFAEQVKELENVSLPGIPARDQLLKKFRAQFDGSARQALKGIPGGLPSFEELKQARDQCYEALAELLGLRARDHLTDIAVCAISTGPKEFIVALLKQGLDPNAKDWRGVTPLAAAEKRPDILQILNSAL